jgi:hypothetical protein
VHCVLIDQYMLPSPSTLRIQPCIHHSQGLICNSSFCMKRRGLAPTGIAIFEAQECGFKSVAHYLQARLKSLGVRKTLDSAAAGAKTGGRGADLSAAVVAAPGAVGEADGGAPTAEDANATDKLVTGGESGAADLTAPVTGTTQSGVLNQTSSAQQRAMGVGGVQAVAVTAQADDAAAGTNAPRRGSRKRTKREHADD